jgi:hypothetical protein
MEKNFVLNDDSISIQMGNQYFDLHNCFDLSGLAIDFSGRQVTLSFTSNPTWIKDTATTTLRLLFSEVNFLSISNGVTMKMTREITELGYKPNNDFDLDWLVNEKKSSKDDHFFIRLIGDEFIRLHGKNAELFLD